VTYIAKQFLTLSMQFLESLLRVGQSEFLLLNKLLVTWTAEKVLV